MLHTKFVGSCVFVVSMKLFYIHIMLLIVNNNNTFREEILLDSYSKQILCFKNIQLRVD